MADTSPRLSRQQALAKAEECRELAKLAHDKAHRIMLNSIAETWERIAETAVDEH